MDVAFMFLTDHSEALNGKIYAMGGGWNTLRFTSFPHEWTFGIAFAVDVPWDETNRRHSLALHVQDPDGDLVGDAFSMEFEAGRPPGAIAGQDQRIVLSLGTQQTFTAPGPHAAVIHVNDEEIGRSRFHVVQLSPEQVPPQMRA